MDSEKQILIKQAPQSLQHLYEKYAGMLYGYIVETVKDSKLAEQHLLAVYNNIPGGNNNFNADGGSDWCQLRQLAKNQISGSLDGHAKDGNFTSVNLNTYYNRNKFLDLMTEEQKHVFCSVYYRGKTTAQLAAEGNGNEDAIRKALKEAFAIIKKGQ